MSPDLKKMNNGITTSINFEINKMGLKEFGVMKKM
jgi:hypothetical protein